MAADPPHRFFFVPPKGRLTRATRHTRQGSSTKLKRETRHDIPNSGNAFNHYRMRKTIPVAPAPAGPRRGASPAAPGPRRSLLASRAYTSTSKIPFVKPFTRNSYYNREITRPDERSLGTLRGTDKKIE